MDAHPIPHFHNEPGVPRIAVGAKKFMCAGAPPPNDHPHVLLEMGAATHIVCPYCGTVFSFDPKLGDRCDPPQCAYLAEPQDDPATLTEEPIRGVVVAAFNAEGEFQKALFHLKAGGFGAVRTYSPNACDAVAGASSLPLFTLLAGAIGVIGGFGVQAYANMVSYPLNIGGRPDFSWPSFVPIAFEIGMLTAMLTAIFGYFCAAPLFSYFEPIDETKAMRRATDDAWIVAVETTGASRTQNARRLLHDLGALSIEEMSR